MLRGILRNGFYIIRNYIPTPIYLKLMYWRINRKALNIKNPKTYAEKLAYLKVYKTQGDLSRYVDKYRVRDYVKEKIGEKYLIPLIGVYNSEEEVPWESLPSEYVLKCNHDTGSVVIKHTQDNLDREATKLHFKKALKTNLYWAGREYPYKNVSPKIVCEKLLDNGSGEIKGYKILCFNGESKYIVCNIGRFSNHRRNTYDLDWRNQGITTDHKQYDGYVEKPEKLDKMILLARKLSEGFIHVRVDFYYVNGEIYFGEMTFLPWAGNIWFTPDEWNYKLGELISIKEKE